MMFSSKIPEKIRLMLTAKDNNLIFLLDGLKDKTKKTSFTVFFKKFGYKKIGEGAYGVVYAKPRCNTVIKVVEHAYNQCYIRYAEYAFKHQANNAYLPKIHAIIPLEHFCVVFMEKLVPSSKEKATAFTKHFRRHYLNGNASGSEIHVSRRSSVKRKRSLVNIQTIGNRIINQWSRDNNENTDNDYAFWDFWPQNIMYRKTGNRFQTVITDPIAG